ncbi:hypothetical protein ACLBXM_11210 [Xanthobacteraceae bacterium A53D]
MLIATMILIFLIGATAGAVLGWQARGIMELRAATSSTAGDDGTADPAF